MRDHCARGYIRESTERQGERFGPDAQRAAIRRAAAELGLELDESSWYVDLVSATGKVVRDELARAIADARAGAFGTLLCYDTSRFARNERLAFDFEDELQRAGVRVYYTLERIWADDEDQAMPKGIFHVINAEYSRKLARRVRDGIAAKRARGGYAGGMPATYRYSADKMRLEPTEATAVRLFAWNLYATDVFSFATLALELNRRGYTYVRTRGKVRPFTKYTIEEIFKTRVDLEVGGLAPEIFKRVHEIMARQVGAAQKPTQRRHHYLFAPFVRCECGERFWGRTQRQKGGRSYAQLYHAPRGCRRGALSEAKLADECGQWLGTWRLPADAKAKIAQYVARPRGDDLRATRRRQVEREIEQLGKQHRWGHISDDAYLAERRQLEGILQELEPETTEAVPSEEVMRGVERIGQVWDHADPEMRRRSLAEWIEKLVIRKDGTIEVHPRAPYQTVVLAATDSRSAPWAVLGSNQRPCGCEPHALTS